jgi:hypothetical protein
MLTIKKIILIIALLVSGVIHSQKIEHYLFSCGGNQFVNEKISLNWAMGDIAISLLKNDQITLEQGFINDLNGNYLVTDKPEYLQTLIYPNPVVNDLIINNIFTENCHFYIFDIEGRLVISGILDEKRKIINSDKLKTGIYTCLVISTTGFKLTSERFLKK